MNERCPMRTVNMVRLSFSEDSEGPASSTPIIKELSVVLEADTRRVVEENGNEGKQVDREPGKPDPREASSSSKPISYNLTRSCSVR
ncbi:hypothetical protein ANCCAN_26968 [Ancylostoma caninum]|uniref:Uncharacterized protein n=1 Tax=Ancylostoma caninum TaxID=29170 RepID=A0A368F8P4_ANCCA|nr:hypothetical protein ANCCAN_26968 [Ancylostoma caninum]